MKDELGLTEQDYAWIINIFTITYATGKFISGKVYDKVGTKIGFILSIFFWSLASVLHFFARGAASLGIFRGLLGVSEAGNWPGAVKNNAEVSNKERTLALGIFNAGAGIGSIVAAASQYMLSGANFIVTPVFREDIAIVCNRRKALWLPGCGSLTEIATAEEMGCEVVKLFPGSTYGPGFDKAIKGPQPWTSIMPTGGVSSDLQMSKSKRLVRCRCYLCRYGVTINF